MVVRRDERTADQRVVVMGNIQALLLVDSTVSPMVDMTASTMAV